MSKELYPLEGVYHTFELPDGKFIEGVWDHRPVMHHYNFPISGKTLADVGCRDGLFSWHFEKIGAEVTGYDIIDRPMRRMLQNEYGAKFKFKHMNVFELYEEPQNAYDIVFCSDVLQHLENPLGALRLMHHITKERAYFVVDLHPALKDRGCVSNDPLLPWHWGPEYFLRLVSLAGFSNPQWLSAFNVSGTMYPTRDVGILTAEADPSFSYQGLLGGPLWASTTAGDLKRTHRVE